MGYSTKFDGELKFNKELTASQLAILNKILGADFRDFSEEIQKEITKGIKEDDMPYYYDLELTDDFSGLKWNGAEKTYGMIGIVNSITQWMRINSPNCKGFAFTGSLRAQGENIGDIWDLLMEDGIAKKVKYLPPCEKITCPHCEKSFYYEGKKNKD